MDMFLFCIQVMDSIVISIFLSVVDCAFQRATPPQRRSLLLELYSTELQLFKDLTEQKSCRLAYYNVLSYICFEVHPQLLSIMGKFFHCSYPLSCNRWLQLFLWCNILKFNSIFQFGRNNFQSWITEIICPAVYDYYYPANFGERYC
jgi:hypothetical protein